MHIATLAAEVAAWQRRMLVLRKPAAARAGPSAGTDSVAGDALGADPGLHVKPQLGQGNDSFLQHGAVELAQVEACTESRLGFCA